ncbi:MAG: hypothetical protein SchgKO_25180 [Schleiferiaceae bacterium]
MKKSLLFLLGLAFSISGYSQNFKDYLEVQASAIKTEKKAVVTQVMQFSEAESEVFWPLYNEFQEKLAVLNKERFDILVLYAENYETMTNELAEELMERNLEMRKDKAALDKKYFKKFAKILDPKRAVKYMQVELDIQLAISGQLAQVLPFVE